MPALEFTDEQRQMIRDTFANGATDDEFAVLMEIARARRLNPLLRQIHFVSRYDRDKGRMVWSCQVSIDGMRALAERSGMYDGQDEPVFVEREGLIEQVKVKVYRKDWSRPAVGVAYWDEYVQKTKDGRPTAFWSRMPHTMLAKCAEALALRKAFPEDTSGLYVPEEMRDDEDSRVTPPLRALPAPTQSAPMAQAEPEKVERQAAPAERATTPADRLRAMSLSDLVKTSEKIDGSKPELNAIYLADWKRRISEAADLAALKRIGAAFATVKKDVREACREALDQACNARRDELAQVVEGDAKEME